MSLEFHGASGLHRSNNFAARDAAECGVADPSDAPDGSLAGQLLIAAPTMSDPRFHHAVILMVRTIKPGRSALSSISRSEIGRWQPTRRALGEKDSAVTGTCIFSAASPT
jgi:hypothetical protein